jgi:hypothetical protein
LAVRIPAWAQRAAPATDSLYRFADTPSADSKPSQPSLRVNGRVVPLAMEKDYAHIRRVWKAGDQVQLVLPMPIQRVLANDAVADDRGAAAIQRGPIVYSIESADNGPSLGGLRLPLDARLEHHFHPELLNGVEVITGTARRVDASGTSRAATLTAVPYYAWANRGKGEMAVWIPYR